MREAQLADLDDILFEWFRQRRSENIPIIGPILCEKAKELHKELNVEIPWLTKFKNCHGRQYLKGCADKVSTDKIAADEFIEEFRKIVEDEKITSELIYNMD